MKAMAMIEISDLVLKSAGRLDERLADLIIQEAENELFTQKKVEAFPIHNLNGFSGYNYWIDGQLIAQLHMASLSSGYYVIMKRVYLEEGTTRVYDYYNQEGEYVYNGESLDGSTTFYNSINMDPTNPFVNHLYNVLCVNYEAAESALGDSQRIAYLERLLNGLLANPRTRIGANDGRRDPALLNIYNEVHRVEADPILNWDERQKVYSSLKQVRSKILRTKSRAHKFNMFTYQAPVNLRDAQTKLELLTKRPVDNFLGLFKKYTWGRLVWFGRTVQANLGLSIAMAIYGPFTFYFITQPMNPHAMWAVGKVRGAYIDFVEGLSSPAKERSLIAKANANEDSVSVKQAAPQKQESSSAGTSQSWADRMSSFKAMQIAYEESLVFAARMGRLEQMENQYLFPLTAEAAWEEMERYLADIEATLAYNPNLDARYRDFLKQETERTLKLQTYIWRKLSQFFADHPYIVVDQENEQTAKDYYTGRGFIFMQKMTDKLAKLDGGKTPHTHKNIAALAKRYQEARKDGDTILESLANNTELFAGDIYDTQEARKRLRRHWEILFLQQNKKQEASSFGLQMYTWSVRNALWTLQSIYSGKRQELGTLTYKYNLNNTGVAQVKSDTAVNMLYESMLNMMVVEFTSIKDEIAKNLNGDPEASERIEVIENLKSWLAERDKLFNNGSAVASKGARQDAI